MPKPEALALIIQASQRRDEIQAALGAQAVKLLELRRLIEQVEEQLGVTSLECRRIHDSAIDAYTEVRDGVKIVTSLAEPMAAIRKRLMSI